MQMANAEGRSEQKGMSTSGNGAQRSMKISREIPAIIVYIPFVSYKKHHLKTFDQLIVRSRKAADVVTAVKSDCKGYLIKLIDNSLDRNGA